MPRDYVLISDDTCDMPPEFYVEHDIPILFLSFTIDGTTYKCTEMSPADFYSRLRQGKTATTAQISVKHAEDYIESFLKEGKDVLYISFSSGLSGSYNSSAIAARMMSEKYPDRKIRVVDSLCASMGEGLFLYKLILMRDAGKSMDELYEWAENNKLNVAHCVMAEDLMHLHRGGRISRTSAVMGSMLGIKPMIHMNEEGRLINIGKVRGRRQGLEALVDRMKKIVGNVNNDIFFVSHSDCQSDAEYVAKLVQDRMGIKEHIIHYIGPVIGSHTGPGTVALFMMAESR